MRHLRRTVGLVALAAVMATGCAGERNPLEIGLRRVALDIAFRDADKALPVPPQEVITQIIPADVADRFDDIEAEPQQGPRPRIIRRLPPPPPLRGAVCAEADANATPERATFAVVKDPPAVGTYHRRNEGTLDITFATFDFSLPYPPSTAWDLPRVEPGNAPTNLSEEDEASVPLPGEVRSNPSVAPPNYEFDLVRHSLPGYSVTDTFSYTYTGVSGGDYLYLRKRVTVADGAVSEFVPTPPIRVVRLNVSPGGDGSTRSDSNHGGVDRATNVAMTIQSDVIGREWVDVCGEMIDTYVVQWQERVVDLSKNPPDVSGNEPDTYNRWNIQFDNGLLIVRESVDTLTRTSVEAGGAAVPVEIRAKYSSTLRSLDVLPLGTKPPREFDFSSGSEPESESEEDAEEEEEGT